MGCSSPLVSAGLPVASRVDGQCSQRPEQDPEAVFSGEAGLLSPSPWNTLRPTEVSFPQVLTRSVGALKVSLDHFLPQSGTLRLSSCFSKPHLNSREAVISQTNKTKLLSLLKTAHLSCERVGIAPCGDSPGPCAALPGPDLPPPPGAHLWAAQTVQTRGEPSSLPPAPTPP